MLTARKEAFAVSPRNTTSDWNAVDDPLLDRYPELLPIRMRLLDHPIYEWINTIERLRRFMEAHVFAVWDFMSLTKRLQNELTCVTQPWQIPGDPSLSRFIDEIAMSEERDQTIDSETMSHLELYLLAMNEVGARTDPILEFNIRLAAGTPPQSAMTSSGVPAHVCAFVNDTLDCALSGDIIEVLAFFLYGREDVIPIMFQRVLDQWAGRHRQIPHFACYLKRHTELDGGAHGTAARFMLKRMAGTDSANWYRASEAARRAIQSRTDLWDGVLATLVD